MKTLDAQSRLEYARAGVAVLRALQITNKTMEYGQFAKAIGLIPDGGRWEPWHRQQVTDILNLVAATEEKSGASTLEYHRIVSKEAGKPGTGIRKVSRIVTSPSEKPSEA